MPSLYDDEPVEAVFERADGAVVVGSDDCDGDVFVVVVCDDVVFAAVWSGVANKL